MLRGQQVRIAPDLATRRGCRRGSFRHDARGARRFLVTARGRDYEVDIDGFVLVHGGCHGAWCWDEVRPLLNLPSVAVDLPGRGHRPTGGRPVTVEQCVAAVEEDAIAAGLSRFVLVGHSMGGITVTEVANRVPDLVAHLVYLAALALPVGGTVSDVYFPDGAPVDDPAGVIPLMNQGTVMDEATAHRTFAADLDPAMFKEVYGRLVPEPVGLYRATVSGYESGVPSTYVQCSRDAAVSHELTEEMVARLRPKAMHRFDSDHDVMLSHPELVAGLLKDIAVWVSRTA
jgi:pimeloyl-ACP methyl ester carboxylesterase